MREDDWVEERLKEVTALGGSLLSPEQKFAVLAQVIGYQQRKIKDLSAQIKKFNGGKKP